MSEKIETPFVLESKDFFQLFQEEEPETRRTPFVYLTIEFTSMGAEFDEVECLPFEPEWFREERQNIGMDDMVRNAFDLRGGCRFLDFDFMLREGLLPGDRVTIWVGQTRSWKSNNGESEEWDSETPVEIVERRQGITDPARRAALALAETHFYLAYLNEGQRRKKSHRKRIEARHGNWVLDFDHVPKYCGDWPVGIRERIGRVWHKRRTPGVEKWLSFELITSIRLDGDVSRELVTLALFDKVKALNSRVTWEQFRKLKIR